MKRLLVVGVASLVVVALSAKSPQVVRRESDLRPLLLRPGVISLFARSQQPLLIDLLWLRALNAVGEFESTRKNRALYEYAVFLTELDPRFFHAYLYLGLNIPFHNGREWVNGELADDVFARGLKVFPDDYRLNVQRAMNAYIAQRDFNRAADYFLVTSRLPGAPAFLAPLAVKLRARDDSTAGLELAQRLLEETDDEQLRADLAAKIRGLQVEAQLKHIDTAADEYTRRTGVAPTHLDDLRMLGVYEGPGVDIFGGTLFLDSRGRAMSTSLTRRVELYE